MITASVVFYKTPEPMVEGLLSCLLRQSLPMLVVVTDNSPTDVLRSLVEGLGCRYLHLPENPGFGAAHNAAFNMCPDSEVHFIVNPDVNLPYDCMEKFLTFFEEHHDVVCAVPRVVYPDGKLQYLCKLLPSPLNLFARRFMPVLASKLDYDFEMRWFNYDAMIDVPYVSGCFMAVRSRIMRKIGGFDTNFFMYLEDTDLSRRLASEGRVVFFPKVEIVHAFAKQSYKNRALLISHIKSAFYYFGKWGWFFDKRRGEINDGVRRRVGKIING